ncbi:hypothetical protein SDC9_08478 [bioreactor metagenome]|uniref:DUF4935 domain-containing protein n=2 Tax=root TaxID=1 RepID=A0A644T7F8_9ZZZZ|nr:hypothetical protein [Methanobrevibacter sp.]
MMTDELESFINNTKHIILDSELLILILAGLCDKGFIKQIKSTKKFSEENYEKLSSILSKFKIIMTTSHILAEFSNLNRDTHTKKDNNYYRKELFEKFKELLQDEYLQEELIDITELTEDRSFNRLGVADIGIKKISKNKDYGVITADLNLYLDLLNSEINCINFSHFME